MLKDKQSFFLSNTNSSLDYSLQNISYPEFQQAVHFEAYKLKVCGVIPTDKVCVFYFPLQHTIPMALAALELGASYISIEGPADIAFHRIFKEKVTVLFTTSSTLQNILNYAKKYSISSSSLRLVIITGILINKFDQLKHQVKTVLRAELIDTIGSSFLLTYAVRCREHSQYHLMDKYIKASVLDISTEKPTKRGELHIQPLWRDRENSSPCPTGDLIELMTPKSCHCHLSQSLTFKKVLGRVDEIIKINGILTSTSELQNLLEQKLDDNQSAIRQFVSRFKLTHSFVLSQQSHLDMVTLTVFTPFYYLQRRNYQNFCKEIKKRYYLDVNLRKTWHILRGPKFIDQRYSHPKSN